MMNTSKGLAHPVCDAQHFQTRQILWEIGLGSSCGSSFWRLVPPTWQKQPSHSRWSLAHHHSIIVQVQAHVVIVRPARVLHQWFQLHVHTGGAPLSEPRLDVGEAFEGFTGQWMGFALCSCWTSCQCLSAGIVLTSWTNVCCRKCATAYNLDVDMEICTCTCTFV